MVVVEIDNEYVFSKGYEYEGIKRTPQQVVDLHLMRNPYIREGFAYNIESNTWYRIIRKKDKKDKRTWKDLTVTDNNKTETF